MTDEPPRLYQHAYKLYEQLGVGSKDEDGKRVFEGSLVAAFREIGVSQSYYSILYRLLKELGCIEVVRSGRGGGAASRVLLHHPPDLDEFQEAYSKSLTNDTPFATIIQRIENIEGRLPSIDLPNYILETEQRIKSLEDRIAFLDRED